MASTKNQPVNVDVDDLRKVYVHTHAAFATDPATIEEEIEGVNAKYGRELLAILVNADLVAEVENGDGEDVWQTVPTYDETSPDEALALFETWAADADLHAITPTAPTKTPKVDVGVHPCYCGCSEKVPGKSFYKPGHDARHAGVVGRLVASTGNKDHYNDLPSAKLTEKAKGICERTLAKDDAKRKAASDKADAKREANKDKAPKTNPPKQFPENGEVKVGKGRFGARRAKDGTVTYKSTDGEWKPASATATKSFKVTA